jgi:type I site-specific restriction endonuclease
MIDLERPVTPKETGPVQLQFPTPLKYLVAYKKQKRMLTGFADYSLWYDEAETMGTNLVVVEAKRNGNAASAEAQCLAYMGTLILKKE